ncbi:MAG: hypothetical protein ACTSU5_11155 [Promethearchaeota archaeon]
MVTSKLKRVISGEMTSRELVRYELLMVSVGGAFLLVARLLYPPENHYSILRDTISFLGSSDADNNPTGWVFFTLALLVWGVMLVPLALHRHRFLREVNRPGAALATIFYLIAAVGLVLVASFPDNGGESFFGDLGAGRVHNFVSIFAFGGFGFGALLDSWLLLKDRVPGLGGRRLYPFRAWGGFYVLFYVVVALIAYTQLYWAATCESGCWPGEGIYSFPLWEWIALAMIFVVFLGTNLGLSRVGSELPTSATGQKKRGI